MAWLRKHWHYLAVAGVLLALLVWRASTWRSSAWLERKLRKTWLKARCAEWKVKREEAEQLHQLRRDVEVEHVRAGKKAVVEIERLAKSPSALVDAYKARLECLRGLARETSR